MIRFKDLSKVDGGEFMWLLISGIAVGIGLCALLIVALKEEKNRNRQKRVLKRIWRAELIIFLAGISLSIVCGLFFPLFLGWVIMFTLAMLSQLFLWSNLKLAREEEKAIADREIGV